MEQKRSRSSYWASTHSLGFPGTQHMPRGPALRNKGVDVRSWPIAAGHADDSLRPIVDVGPSRKRTLKPMGAAVQAWGTKCLNLLRANRQADPI